MRAVLRCEPRQPPTVGILSLGAGVRQASAPLISLRSLAVWFTSDRRLPLPGLHLTECNVRAAESADPGCPDLLVGRICPEVVRAFIASA